ncbi:hypothetical protein [Nonomuraea basaltis]|uniref:hypothetical protein n=1 Tax=Nonomuraea basaltis TaxID=2495887 RepID=UPI00110C4D48|nr:hypothetical protein [Nonomuraea basaltis]TMR96126.1 hypothetical protein EJK15_25285 [Nonomuraea basaltis]
MLKLTVGVDPDEEPALVSAAAVGLVLDAWRNSPLEDIHSEDNGPSDGEMFAQSVYLYRKAKTALTAARKGNLRPMFALEGMITNPQRRWAGGSSFTLASTGADLAAFHEHVESRLWYVRSVIEEEGWRAALLRKAFSAVSASHHYGMPKWPHLVDGAMIRLAAFESELLPEPLKDQEAARTALREEPDRLGIDALEWLIARGFLLQQL